MERMFFIRRRRISITALVLCCALAIFLIRTFHKDPTQNDRLRPDLEQSTNREENNKFQDEQDFVESEQFDQTKDETDWVEPPEAGNQAAHEQETEEDENRGSKTEESIDEKIDEEKDLNENTEKEDEHKNEQFVNTKENDSYETEKDEGAFEKDDEIDKTENEIPQKVREFVPDSDGLEIDQLLGKVGYKDNQDAEFNEEQETRDTDQETPATINESANVTSPTADNVTRLGKKSSTSATASEASTKMPATDHVTESEIIAISEISATNHVTETGDETTSSTRSKTTPEIRTTYHVTESVDETISSTTESKTTPEVHTTDHVPESVDETTPSSTESMTTPEIRTNDYMNKSGDETPTITGSKTTQEVPTADHMTKSGDENPTSTTGLKTTLELHTNDHVTKSGDENPTSTTGLKTTLELHSNDHMTKSGDENPTSTTGSKTTPEVHITDHVTKSGDESPTSTKSSKTAHVAKSGDESSTSTTESKTATKIPSAGHVIAKITTFPSEADNRPQKEIEESSKTANNNASVTEQKYGKPKAYKLRPASKQQESTRKNFSNKTETSSWSTSTPTPQSLTTLASSHTNSNDNEDEYDKNHSSTPVYTPKPHYTFEPTVSGSNSPKHVGCILPKLDPFDRSILHLLKDVGTNPGCRDRYPQPLFDVVKNRLVPKKGENVSNRIEFESVRVETYHRNENDDNNFHSKEQGNPFMEGKNLNTTISSYMNKSDFFRIKYKMKEGDEIKHYFLRVVPQESVVFNSRKARKELTAKNSKAEGLPLNVLVIGIDSTAANNFYRKLHHTLDFLRRKLNTYFFKGYSVIGDATTPALSAIMTGKREHELPEGRQGFDGAQPVDNWPWLSKNYKARGYATLFAEDDPRFGAFNLRLLGFREPPYDHYSRPFWLALEDAGARDGSGLCSKSISMVNYTIEYLKSYFEAYPDTPKFAFAFAGYLAHAHPNHLSYADYDLLYFLKFLVKNKYHENTMLVLLGDHGSRNDDVRNTMQGKLEERLPWLSITLPKWVEKKYPEIGKAMKRNQQIICTPFDLHFTLQHLLTYPIRPQGERGRSLFDELPANRTCKDADIGEHWCPCLQFHSADTSDSKILRAAKEVVKSINNRTSINRLLMKSCVRLSLKSILSAVSFEPNEKVQTFSSTNQDGDREVNFGDRTPDSKHFQITIQTSPGNGRFEATVTVNDDGTVIVNPDISRTNTYGNQPKCILRKYPYVRKFCLCKT